MLDSKNKKIDAAFFALLIIFVLFSLWKANKGYGSIDEAFYLAVPKRMLQGDILLSDEWHVTQMPSILLVPLMILYELIAPSQTGIILIFRYLYVIIQACFTVYIYYCIRGRKWAIAAVLPFMLFVHHNIMALSYFSMGAQFFAATLATINRGKLNAAWMSLAGVFFAASVLCCPYLAIVYLIYVAAAIAAMCVPYLKNYKVLEMRSLLAFSCGCAILAAITITHILQSPIEIVLQSLPHILDDPVHPSRPVLRIIMTYFTSLAKSSIIAVPVMAIYAVLFLWAIFDARHREGKSSDLIFSLSIITSLVYIASLWFEEPVVSIFGITLPIIGLFAFVTGKKRDWEIFSFNYAPAMAFTFLVHCASNQYFYAISSSAIVASIPSVFLINNRISEMDTEKKTAKLSKLLSVCAIAAVCMSILFYRVAFTYWDENVTKLKYKIDKGANKGIWTTEEKYLATTKLIVDTQLVREQEGKVLYIELEPELYLIDDKETASYSAYENLSTEDAYGWVKLLAYYEINPDKRPDCVYMSKSSEISPEQVLDKLEMTGEIVETKYGYTILACK